MSKSMPVSFGETVKVRSLEEPKRVSVLIEKGGVLLHELVMTTTRARRLAEQLRREADK